MTKLLWRAVTAAIKPVTIMLRLQLKADKASRVAHG